MKWTKEDVVKELQKNPNFHNFTKEFQGEFHLQYQISGVSIIFYNAVGGYVEVFFRFWCDNADIMSARSFAIIGQHYLQDLVNKNSYI